MTLLCPNCDGLLNANGCQSCGWKMGDPWPAHRLVTNSTHPLIPGVTYPERGFVRNVKIVSEPKVLNGVVVIAKAVSPAEIPIAKVQPVVVPPTVALPTVAPKPEPAKPVNPEPKPTVQ